MAGANGPAEIVKPGWESSKKGLTAAQRHLGRRLKEHREDHDLSEEDASTIAGVPLALYRKYERGTAIIDHVALCALARHYDCAPSDLMPKRTYPNAPIDPARRNLHFAQRNAGIRSSDMKFHRSGTEGAVKKGKE